MYKYQKFLSSLASLARIHINFLNVSVFAGILLLILVSCQYECRVYSASYHKQGRRSVFRIGGGGGGGPKVKRSLNFRRASRAHLQYKIMRANRKIWMFIIIIIIICQYFGVVIYSAFQHILALHVMNFSRCQNYWGGGGGERYVPPPPHISTHIIFVGTFGGLAPPIPKSWLR